MTTALDALLAGESTWPDALPMNLSPSQISEFAACPDRWRRKKLLGESDPSSAAALIGKAVHRSIEHGFRVKLETGELPPIDEAEDAAREGFDVEQEEAEERYGLEWGDTKRDEAIDTAVSLASRYRILAAPEVEPVAIEQRTEDKAIPGFGVPVYGYVDIEEKEGILDVKTVSVSTTAKKPRGDDRLKGLVYIWLTGKPIGWHYLKKTKEPSVFTHKQEPGLFLPATSMVVAMAERRVQQTAAEMVHLYKTYGPEDPWPTTATEHQWRCDYCSLRTNCSWWAS